MVQLLYDLLRALTGYTPPWGILTGVRPAKLMSRLVRDWNEERAAAYFQNELLVQPEKTALAQSVARAEAPVLADSRPESFSLYISIPFCPTRCSYCSFVSHSNEGAKKLIPRYLDHLLREIAATGDLAKQLGLRLESIYIGGGTPTALNAEDLTRITGCIRERFDFSTLREYTIEAGRPDSVTPEKLLAIQNGGATRISINPQTFNDDVLREIGRRHTAKQTKDALVLARSLGFDNINMDLIAGLPTDTVESFQNTLETTLSFLPENVTVHTLALKRAATLVTEQLPVGDAAQTEQMLALAFDALSSAGYAPYYMYRQSNCIGNLENVGWAKQGRECLYNVYMMEECHTVLACGAGAVTKLCVPNSTNVERIFNFKYPYEYIDRFDELMARKVRVEAFYREMPEAFGFLSSV
jgi:oxygen-independent coproporphyrinogen-3 oxidase